MYAYMQYLLHMYKNYCTVMWMKRHTHISIWVCVCVCVYVCAPKCMLLCVYTHKFTLVCMYVCVCVVLCAYVCFGKYACMTRRHILKRLTRTSLAKVEATARSPACQCGVLMSLLASSCAGRQAAAAPCSSEQSRARGGGSATASVPWRCKQAW